MKFFIISTDNNVCNFSFNLFKKAKGNVIMSDDLQLAAGGTKFLKNSSSLPKVEGAGKVTRTKFRTEGPKILSCTS